MSGYLKSFISGSSILIVFPFYIEVLNIPKSKRNYTYQLYTQIAPLYLGMMNMFSYCLQTNLGLSNLQRLLLISIISPSIVVYIAKQGNSYNFSKKEWMLYSIYIFLRHLVTYFIVIYFIERLI